MTAEQIEALRMDYTRIEGLDESEAPADPIVLFRTWFGQALGSNLTEPNAMCLATVDAKGRPNARMVLLKGFDERGFVFYTNYESQKGRELEAHPQASLVMYWPGLERQVRVRGTVSRTSDEQSEAYFRSRPADSRLGAAVSPQSEPIPGRQWLEERWREFEARYPEGVPRPANWGGYCLTPETIEFWQGRRSRLHDRIRYTRDDGGWRIERLAP